jgi:hypothetical protein
MCKVCRISRQSFVIGQENCQLVSDPYPVQKWSPFVCIRMQPTVPGLSILLPSMPMSSKRFLLFRFADKDCQFCPRVLNFPASLRPPPQITCQAVCYFPNDHSAIIKHLKIHFLMLFTSCVQRVSCKAKYWVILNTEVIYC